MLVADHFGIKPIFQGLKQLDIACPPEETNYKFENLYSLIRRIDVETAINKCTSIKVQQLNRSRFKARTQWAARAVVKFKLKSLLGTNSATFSRSLSM